MDYLLLATGLLILVIAGEATLRGAIGLAQLLSVSAAIIGLTARGAPRRRRYGGVHGGVLPPWFNGRNQSLARRRYGWVASRVPSLELFP